MLCVGDLFVLPACTWNIATMVLQFIIPDLDAACLIYNDMMFKVALGIDQKRHVRLRLDKLAVK